MRATEGSDSRHGAGSRARFRFPSGAGKPYTSGGEQEGCMGFVARGTYLVGATPRVARARPSRLRASHSVTSGKVRPDRQVSESGQRYYSPELGRWLSRDPIGEQGGQNQYVYVSNAPTTLTDLLGLLWRIRRDPEHEWGVAVPETDYDTFFVLANDPGVDLDYGERNKWVKYGSGFISLSDRASPGCRYGIPNLVVITQGDTQNAPYYAGPVNGTFNDFRARSVEFKTDMNAKRYKVEDNFTSDRFGQDISAIGRALDRASLYIWGHFGHGSNVGGIETTSGSLTLPSGIPVQHHINMVVAYSCYSLRWDWSTIVSGRGEVWGNRTESRAYWGIPPGSPPGTGPDPRWSARLQEVSIGEVPVQ
jgi:RHS repeat-associated protein